ncbi:hypothetical protein Tco_0610561 [Tanacetum coccineum]
MANRLGYQRIRWHIDPWLLLPPHHHVPIGRPRKKRRMNNDEIVGLALKIVVKGGKMSKNGTAFSYDKCGGK